MLPSNDDTIQRAVVIIFSDSLSHGIRPVHFTNMLFHVTEPRFQLCPPRRSFSLSETASGIYIETGRLFAPIS